MTTDPILIDQTDHVATVTLNRPDKGNALTSVLWHELAERMGELGQQTEVRAVILRGAGDRVFCAGADMREFLGTDYETSRGYGQIFDDALHRIAHHPVPVIAQIHGQALGGGCQLALACDFRIAGEGAQLGIPAAKLGLVVPPGAHERLIHLVGLQHARQIMYLGRRYDAQQSLAMGLVDCVVADVELEDTVQSWASEISANAPLAVRAAKHALNATLDRTAWDQARDRSLLKELNAESHRAFTSQDTAEGLAAFFQKRPPEFTGQ